MKKSTKTVKLTKKRAILKPKHVEMKGFLSFFILHDLASGSQSGDELAMSIGERKGTMLTPGTIYPALKRLRRQKLISYKRNGRKKMYSLTEEGKREIKALYAVFSTCFSGLKGRLKR